MAQRIVGLDIGTSALRAVEVVTDNGGKPSLEAYGQVGLPPGAIVDGEVRDAVKVSAALRRLWKEGGFKSTQVHLGVAGLRAITREMELPPLPPEELNAAVSLQAEDVVPFPIERTSLASSVISRTVDGEGMPLIRVLVAAAHRDLIDGVVAAVEDAGLEPVAIDLDTAALSRAFTLPGSATDPEAVVSIGAGLTMVIVHHGGMLQFVRTIDLGGDTMTRAVSSALDIPFTDAEQTKRRLALQGPQDPTALAAVARVVNELVAEIHNSIRYYSALPGRTPPSRLIVTGGASRTVGLLDKVQQGLELPVVEASPLSFVDVSRLGISATDSEEINPTVAVPLGLALNGPTRTRFDLMPQEVMAKRAERSIRRAFIIAGVAVVVILAALSAWRVLAVRSAQHQVTSLQSAVQTITAVQIPKYDRAVQLGDQVTQLQGQLKPLVDNEVDWLVVLNQLGQYLPASATLGDLDISAAKPMGSSPQVAPVGSALTSKDIGFGSTTVATKNLTEVTQFGLAMAKSPGLANVALSGSVSSASTGVRFPVSFEITNAAHSQREKLFEERIP
jgi:type IV pilus assembly protein PilM